MASTAETGTPAHLWIVGILALLWNAFGAYDYWMTRTHDLAYIAKSMPGVDPATAIAWVEGMPLYAQIGWGLGVWCGLLGAILLVMRSRYAVWAFALSMLGILLSIGYDLVLAPPLPGANGTMNKVMPYVIIIVGAALLAYSNAMHRRGALR
jgi:hypothetical protein